jgi:hypothetical protein
MLLNPFRLATHQPFPGTQIVLFAFDERRRRRGLGHPDHRAFSGSDGRRPGNGKNNTTLKAMARSIVTLAGKHKAAQSPEQKFVRNELSQGMLSHSTQG